MFDCLHISISQRLDGLITILSIEIAINGSISSILSWLTPYLSDLAVPCFDSLNRLYTHHTSHHATHSSTSGFHLNHHFNLHHPRHDHGINHSTENASVTSPQNGTGLPVRSSLVWGPWPCSAQRQVPSPAAAPAPSAPPRCHGGDAARAPGAGPPGDLRLVSCGISKAMESPWCWQIYQHSWCYKTITNIYPINGLVM